MAEMMNGKALAEKMQSELAEKVSILKQEKHIVPFLVVILVGDDAASQIYVRNKERAAKAAGFKSKVIKLSENISQLKLLEVIRSCNEDSSVHGILVQLPLPKQINEEDILFAISPDKDVDGFHPVNMGKLWSGHPVMVPCTPAGIMELLKAYHVDLEGKSAVVVGRSNIVGKPMAQLLLNKNATVTLTHSRTHHLAEIAKKADVLVVAIGRGHFVTKEFVKEGAVVIDVGMNRNQNGKLIGDVDYDAVKDIASLITPVPGGVGPMTITMLLEQTYAAAVRSLSSHN